MDFLIPLLTCLNIGVVLKTVRNLEPFLNIDEQEGILYYRIIIVLKMLFMWYNVNPRNAFAHCSFVLINAYVGAMQSELAMLSVFSMGICLLTHMAGYLSFTPLIIWTGMIAVNIKPFEFIMDTYILVFTLWYAFQTYKGEIPKLHNLILVGLCTRWYMCNEYIKHPFSFSSCCEILGMLIISTGPLKPKQNHKHLYFYAVLFLWVLYKFQTTSYPDMPTSDTKSENIGKMDMYENKLIKTLETVDSSLSPTGSVAEKVLSNLTPRNSELPMNDVCKLHDLNDEMSCGKLKGNEKIDIAQSVKKLITIESMSSKEDSNDFNGIKTGAESKTEKSEFGLFKSLELKKIDEDLRTFDKKNTLTNVGTDENSNEKIKSARESTSEYEKTTLIGDVATLELKKIDEDLQNLDKANTLTNVGTDENSYEKMKYAQESKSEYEKTTLIGDVTTEIKSDREEFEKYDMAEIEAYLTPVTESFKDLDVLHSETNLTEGVKLLEGGDSSKIPQNKLNEESLQTMLVTKIDSIEYGKPIRDMSDASTPIEKPETIKVSFNEKMVQNDIFLREKHFREKDCDEGFTNLSVEYKKGIDKAFKEKLVQAKEIPEQKSDYDKTKREFKCRNSGSDKKVEGKTLHDDLNSECALAEPLGEPYLNEYKEVAQDKLKKNEELLETRETHLGDEKMYIIEEDVIGKSVTDKGFSSTESSETVTYETDTKRNRLSKHEIKPEKENKMEATEADSLLNKDRRYLVLDESYELTRTIEKVNSITRSRSLKKRQGKASS